MMLQHTTNEAFSDTGVTGNQDIFSWLDKFSYFNLENKTIPQQTGNNEFIDPMGLETLF